MALNSLVLDLVPILPTTLVGYPEPTPLPATGYCPTCIGGGGSIANIVTQIVNTLGTPGNMTAQTPLIGNTMNFYTDACDTTTIAPQYMLYAYSSPINPSASINGSTLTDIIQNPFGTVYKMSPLTGVYYGIIGSGILTNYETISTPFKINPNDFVSDGNLYIEINWQCNAPKTCDTAGCNQYYTFTIQVFLQLNPTEAFFTRCCASIDITSVTRQEFCPGEYAGESQTCIDLLNTYCTDPEYLSPPLPSSTILDPVCGCYPEYIQEEIVDKNPFIEKWLKGTKLVSGCATSCNAATAWTGGGMQEPCQMDLTICQAEIANMGGEINTGANGIQITQECNGDGPTPSPTPPPPPISKTVIIASIAAGAVILLVLIILVIMIL